MDGLTSPPSCALTLPGDLHTFSLGEKCEKPLETPHPQGEKLQMKLKNPVLGENLEDHREELEWQRSARSVLLKPVLGEILEDLL